MPLCPPSPQVSRQKVSRRCPRTHWQGRVLLSHCPKGAAGGSHGSQISVSAAFVCDRSVGQDSEAYSVDQLGTVARLQSASAAEPARACPLLRWARHVVFPLQPSLADLRFLTGFKSGPLQSPSCRPPSPVTCWGLSFPSKGGRTLEAIFPTPWCFSRVTKISMLWCGATPGCGSAAHHSHAN